MVRPESQRSRFGTRGVVSLLDMLKIFGDLFVKRMYEIHTIELSTSHPQATNIPLSAHNVAAVFAHVSTFGLECQTLELDSAAAKCQRIANDFKTNPKITHGYAYTMLRELRERFEDDLKEHVFFELSQGESSLYNDPLKEWSEVVGRFPKIRFDIEEAAKCYAFARYGAAVFHAMLIAEFGVIEAAKFFGAEGDKPGWGCLERLRKINDKKWEEKSEREQKYSKFLADLLPLAFAMKDSWRHKMDHIDNKLVWMDTNFSPELAGEIVQATAGFMRRLAADLPK